MTSPSRTTYSLPSMRSLPAAFAAASVSERVVVGVADHLGLDEAALEVACG